MLHNPIPIKSLWSDGEREVMAESCADGLFGLHPWSLASGGVTVTHIPSGRSVCVVDDYPAGRALAQELYGIREIDWQSYQKGDLRQAPRGTGAKVMAAIRRYKSKLYGVPDIEVIPLGPERSLDDRIKDHCRALMFRKMAASEQFLEQNRDKLGTHVYCEWPLDSYPGSDHVSVTVYPVALVHRQIFESGLDLTWETVVRLGQPCAMIWLPTIRIPVGGVNAAGTV